MSYISGKPYPLTDEETDLINSLDSLVASPSGQFIRKMPFSAFANALPTVDAATVLTPGRNINGVFFDGSTDISITDPTLPKFTSGIYTPTRSAEANMDANVVMTKAQYLRVGGTVSVSGRFTANPTLAATVTSFEMSLPIASSLQAVADVAGVAFSGSIAGMGGEVVGVVANATAKVQWISSDPNANLWSYAFDYQVF